MAISTTPLRKLGGVLAALLLAGAATSVSAAPLSLPGSLPNMAGLGIGSTTEFAGGKDRMIGVVPGLRYVTPGGRLLEWYGPYAQFNFGGLTGFQWGPAVGLRLGRNDVDDPVVSRLHEIDTTFEAGGYVGYEYLNQGRVPWRLRGGVNVMTNAGIIYGGTHIAATGSLWVPQHPRVYAGAGLGATWVSGSFNRTYFGVTPSDSAASGLPVYSRAGAWNSSPAGWRCSTSSTSTGMGGDGVRPAPDRRCRRQPHRDPARHAQPGHLRGWHRLCVAVVPPALAMIPP